MTTLSIVPTPIGNLKDITLRGLELLKTRRIIICEDTRVTKKLLSLVGIPTTNKVFLSYYEPKEAEKLPEIIEFLTHEDGVLVSDAGTPMLNDPGFLLVKAIKTYHENINIEVLPGPSAITTALINSGISSNRFMFVGFLPDSSAEIKVLLESLKKIDNILETTFICFDSPLRIRSSLSIFNKLFGENVEISINRELTKKFEQMEFGNPKFLLEKIKSNELILKGEFVIVFRLLNFDRY